MNNRAVGFLKAWFAAFIYPRPLIGLLGLPRYVADYVRYRAKSDRNAPRPRLIDTYPCLADRLSHTPFDAHYFYQASWLARKIAEDKPKQHTDISSSVLAIGVLSGFVDTVFVDYRPLNVKLPRLTCRAGDITNLPFGDCTQSSLSCLHVIEHIGLGRYGDPLDPLGSSKAAKELQRVLRPGGSLYLSTPVGRERTCFNAHRIFSPGTICRLFSQLQLVSFSCVDDAGQFKENVPEKAAAEYLYGCGMFHFRRPAISENRQHQS